MLVVPVVVVAFVVEVVLAVAASHLGVPFGFG